MRLPLVSFMLALAACAGSEKDTAGGGDNGGDSGDSGADCTGIDCWVNVDVTYVGDTTCFDGTNWGLGQTVDPAYADAMVTLTGTISDFQEDEPVEGASLKFWFNDNISGTPDISAESDASGQTTQTVPACMPLAYETYTPPEWEKTKDTYEVHQVYSPTETSDTWNSVSVATSRLIPSLLGLTWDPATGIIAGTAYDCNEDPIQNAQVYIHDASGNAPDTMQIRYFANGLPNSDQPYTNDDGLFSAVNVPVGDWIVEVWAYDGTQLVKLGATELAIRADSVNISNVYTGIEDGVFLPSSCLAQ